MEDEARCGRWRGRSGKRTTHRCSVTSEEIALSRGIADPHLPPYEPTKITILHRAAEREKFIPVTPIPLAGRLLIALFLTIANLDAQTTPAAKPALPPLRVFMRSGPKSHGPGDHDHPSFLRDWTKVLAERGAEVSGGDVFPTAEQLAKTDVVIIHRQVGGNFSPAELAIIDTYAKRGGGFVVIHAGNVAGGDASADYYRDLIGGSWRQKVTKWREGQIKLNFVDKTHAIAQGVEDFGMKDEIYYDMDLRTDIHVLATAPTPKKKATNSKPNRKSGLTKNPTRSARSFSSRAMPMLISAGPTSAACCSGASRGRPNVKT